MEPSRASHPGGDHTAVSQPEPALVRRNLHTHGADEGDEADNNEREATELHGIRNPTVRSDTHIVNPDRPVRRYWYDPARRLWRNNIQISVPHVDCRDHLANERTYLGYLRTAVALSVLGVTVAQLYRLQHAAAPDAAFGYFVLSKPVAGLFQGSALVVTLIGAGRFYRQQHAMAVGKVRAGGWEVYLVSVFVLFLLIGMFAVHVGIDVYKTD